MKESKLAIILALAALDDSEIKSLEERVNELAELGFKPEIVDELPEEGNDHTLYLVPQSEPGEDPWYKEYLWLDNEWENIGTTSINFENYELKSNKITTLDEQSTDEQYPSAKAVFDMIKSGEYKVYPSHTFAYYADEHKKGVYVYYNAMTVGMFGYRLKKTDSSKYIYALPLMFFVFEDVDVNNPPQKDTVVASLYGITNMQKLTAFSFTYKTDGTLTVSEGRDFGTSSPANWLRFLNTSSQTIDGIKTFSSLPVSTPVPTQDGQLTNKKYVDDAIVNNATQYSTMPTPAAGNEGDIIQYIGASTQDYTQGYFYKCVSDGEQEPTYSWEQIDVQLGGGQLYTLNIGNHTLDDFDDHIYYGELYNQLEDLIHTWWSKKDNLSICITNDDGEVYYANLARYEGTLDIGPTGVDDFSCWLDVVGLNNVYSLTRDRDCPENEAWWYFDTPTVHEFTKHKTTTLNNNSTDREYPSAKAVWDLMSTNSLTMEVASPIVINDRVGLFFMPDVRYTNGFNYKITSTSPTYKIPANENVYPVVLCITKKLSTVSSGEICGYLYGFQESTGAYIGYFVQYSPSSGKLTTSGSNSTKGCLVTEGAQTIKGVKTFNNLPISNLVPTNNNQLTNKQYVDDKIAAINTLKREIVQQLPTSNIDPNTIYMVPKIDPGTQNIYDEWMYINDAWEKIGTTEVDLTNYLAKDNTVEYVPSGQYNPSTKGYVDNYFFNSTEANWDLLTAEQQAAFAVAVVEYGLYDLTEEDEDNLSSIMGSDEPIISDMTEEEGIEITNEIIGGNE